MARIRFRPPPIEPPAELPWLLRAAFADRFPCSLEDGLESTALDLADRLGLAAPIGGRLRAAHGTIPLPASMAERFCQAHANSAIRAMMHERTARQIAKIAARKSIPVAFLKGFALFLAGRDRSGGRPIGDLDILVPETSAGTLHAELRRSGYQATSEAGNEHHLATLVSPEGSPVDIHFCIRDLSLGGGRWATWATLEELGGLVSIAGYPDHCAVPRVSIQAAHLLVHGLAHHAWRPHTYPLLLLVGDLNELLPDESSWQEFLGSYRRILLRSIRPGELDAMRTLALRLKAARVPDLASPRPGEDAVLLAHILAGYLEPAYARGLWLRHTLGRLGDAARQGRLWSYLARKTGRQRIQ